MLSRVRNASHAHHDTVSMPTSKIKASIADILKQEGYIADYTVDTIVERLGAKPLVMQLPIGAEDDFDGVVDLLNMQAITWRGKVETGAEPTYEEIPEDLKEKAEQYREQLVEAVAESDEELMEKYFGGEELSIDELKAGIRKLTINSEIYPVYCGTAYRNKGVQPLLDAVVDFLPNPLDVGEVIGHAVGDEDQQLTRKPSVESSFSALSFKIAAHPFFGQLNFVRVYSGQVTPGTEVMNSTKGKKERIGKLFQMHANKENPVEQADAGNIYAVVGLKETTTGDTLCDKNDQIILESMDFPDPVIKVSIEEILLAYALFRPHHVAAVLAVDDAAFLSRLADG